ncbi:MAG: SH3 domain-containing protein [Candidatus Ventricola sp.]|nr:SH3 domain-containing protein [Candidatus Ventricola sp.]
MKKKWIALVLVLAVMLVAWLSAMDSFALDQKEMQAARASAGETLPEEPKQPETPEQTDAPEHPEQTDAPETPEQTDAPETPEQTDAPEAPEQTDAPETPDQTDAPEETEDPTELPTPEETDTPEPTDSLEEELTPETTPEAGETPVPEKLRISLHANRSFAFAWEDEVRVELSVTGGVPEYDVSFSVWGERNEARLDQNGRATFSYTPEGYGEYTITATVADGSGQVERASVNLIAAERGGESESDRLRSVQGASLTGDWRHDIVAIAGTQVGWSYDERCFMIDEAGDKHYYSRYGDWWGAPYSDWCAMFVAFCAHYAQIPDSDCPTSASCGTWKDELERMGVYRSADSGYRPQSGDIVFFTWAGKKGPSHMGIVERADSTTLYTIEGNVGGVRRKERERNATVTGYGSMEAIMLRAGKLRAEEMREPAGDVTATPAIEVTTAPTVTPTIEVTVTPTVEVTAAPTTVVPAQEEPGYTPMDRATAGYTMAGTVNVRSGPSTRTETVGQVSPRGSRVDVLGAVESDGELWFAVKAGRVEGYIFGELLRLEEIEEEAEEEETGETGETPEPTDSPESTPAPEETASPEPTATTAAETTSEPTDAPADNPLEGLLAYTTRDAVLMRAEPSEKADRIGRLDHANTQVILLGISDDGLWLRVQYGAQQGYIYAKLLSVTEQRAEHIPDMDELGMRTGYTAVSGVSLYDRPSEKGGSMTIRKKGTELAISGTEENEKGLWYLVQFGSRTLYAREVDVVFGGEGIATATPTAEPTATPTAEPTATPTAEPTATPTAEPTATPTAEPTATPPAEPTATPTVEPTATPTAEPTATPTAEPTVTPTAEPTEAPVTYCNLEEHAHDAECFDGSGAFICRLPEHVHSEACLIQPTMKPAATPDAEAEEALTKEIPALLTARRTSEPEETTLETTPGEAEPDETPETTPGEAEPDETPDATQGEATPGEATSGEATPGEAELEEQKTVYEQYLAEVEALEAIGELDELSAQEANALLERLREAFEQRELTQEEFEALYNRVFFLLYGDPNSIAEAAKGSNWMSLRDSGWFQRYSGSTATLSRARRAAAVTMASMPLDAGERAAQPSDVQVKDRGGSNAKDDGSVSVSKTIAGTELENVFDITLQVQTSVNVSQIVKEPDMAIVIVMDISNTMNSDFGGVTRYAAAMTAAESFLDQFAENNSLGISKVGYVAFNTDAHQIFGLQPCSTQAQADALKNTMRTQTGSIINAWDYDVTHNRFTNVEAGLAMASDMLNKVSNENKFIIFLSDGFPTTYISSGYSGYDPYDSTGRFYDHVLNKKCLYGTSYSDEAAIRARKKAAAIKGAGTTIFSIGVNVAGQTIQNYITQSEKANGFSVVDRTGTTYEIGDASSTESYKSWLREKIGSGYYYDSTDSAGLTAAYNQIFEEIKQSVAAGAVADWVASDPLPTVGGSTETVEFIGFYSKEPKLVEGNLKGSHDENGENTAAFVADKAAISWNLKESGYQTQNNGTATVYLYELVYRVRLKNETGSFAEGTIYPTNDTTSLQYRTIEGTDGNLTVSDPKTIEFPIPSVQGYLAELRFTKTDGQGGFVPGAVFTLSHDTSQCAICRGNKTSVPVESQDQTSTADGIVSFTGIPSGHIYTLQETMIPDGYVSNGNTYTVSVAYDKVTVAVQSADGSSVEWSGVYPNQKYFELPRTGGTGPLLYTSGGLLLMAASAFLLYIHNRRRKEDNQSS